MQPLISIITTYYNYERYLPFLRDSVFKQSWQNWEWLIVDDASEDNVHVALGDALVSPRVKVFRHPQNRGYSEAKNTALRAAKGDFFVMIDADDVLTDNSLEVRYDALASAKDKMWVHGDALNYNLNGEIEETYIRWNRQARKKYLAAGHVYHHRMIHAQTVMVRREFHEKLGLYDPLLRFSSDNEMWRRAIRFGVIPIYVPKPVAIYRAHGARMSRSDFKRKHVLEVKEYIIKIVEDRYNLGLEATNTERLLCQCQQ